MLEGVPTQNLVQADVLQETFLESAIDNCGDAGAELPQQGHDTLTEPPNRVELNDDVLPTRLWCSKGKPELANLIPGFAEYFQKLTAGKTYGKGADHIDTVPEDLDKLSDKKPPELQLSDSLSEQDILSDLTLATESDSGICINERIAQVNNKESQITNLEAASEEAHSTEPDPEATIFGAARAKFHIPKDPEEVIIRRLRSCSTLSVPLKVENICLRAIVDTAAEVTIISDRVLQSLLPTPSKVRDVTLCTAGRDLKMKGQVVGPLRVEIGSEPFMEEVYVAPIEDDMLLGLDFLRKHDVDIHIKDMNLVLNGRKISMEPGTPQGPDKVVKVNVSQAVVIPSNTVRRVARNLDLHLEAFRYRQSRNVQAHAPPAVYEGSKSMQSRVWDPGGKAGNVTIFKSRKKAFWQGL